MESRELELNIAASCTASFFVVTEKQVCSHWRDIPQEPLGPTLLFFPLALPGPLWPGQTVRSASATGNAEAVVCGVRSVVRGGG